MGRIIAPGPVNLSVADGVNGQTRLGTSAVKWNA